MNIRKKPLIILLAGSLLLGSAAAMAFGGGHDFGKGGCDRGNPMQALQQVDNVTDEQRSALRKLFDEQRDSMRDQRDAMRDSRRAIRDAIQSGASTDEIRKLANQQGKLVTDMIMARAETRQKMAAILTPDQMKQLQDYRSDRMERHDRW